MSQPKQKLPHWNLSDVFPGLESEAFETAFNDVIESITELEQQFADKNINRIDDPVSVNEDQIHDLETIINQFNDVLTAVVTIRAYIFSFIATDSRNSLAQAKLSELQPRMAKIGLLDTQLTAWLGSLDVETLIERSEIAAAHAYTLHKAKKGARHLMSPAEENLAAELGLTGKTSWQKLFNDYSSQLKVELELEGEMQTLPLTAAQNLAYHKNRDVRARAYQATIDTLSASAIPLAAALNAIKGETLTLSQRRGWESPLEMTLFQNALDRPTLDAMMTACTNFFPELHRYLRARAKALDLPVLAWYDQLVALGEGTQSWAYDDASQFVISQFGTYSDKMKQLAQRAFSQEWIDAEPRDGKRGGAFCMNVRPGESRILMNFESGFTSVGTLAHELGHAYHNVTLGQRTPLQQNMPMTLAETASTFCQKIVENAALAKADKEDQKIIIDGLLEYASRVILGASSNFIFEQNVFEKRAQRELSVDDFCELDIASQVATRGDAIDNNQLYPYRWAYVPHYYISTYYNYPYIFGLLFGLGLYAEYQRDPDGFRDGYDDLLSSAGMGDAAELAGRFGMDIRQPAFWEASLAVLKADIDRFEVLVEG